MSLRCLAALLPVFALSCQPTDDWNTDESAIIGGFNADNDTSVVQLRVFGLCTATLVAPEVVLTAAHCVDGAIESGNTSVGSVRFGNGRDPWITEIGVRDMVMHRLYRDGAFTSSDIALVRLDAPAPPEIPIIKINRRNFTQEDVGLPVRVVGFGHTDGAAQTGAGQKRQVRLTVDRVDQQHLVIGTATANTCQGDSGGPTFAMFDGAEEVIAVTSFGSDECRGLSYIARTDAFYDEFLEPVLNAWSGPCPADNSCDEDCEVPDPDCDLCLFEGTCRRECDNVDLDCALGSLYGGLCGDVYDCETRLCTPAPDDERLNYCTVECDPTLSALENQCEPPLNLCRDVGDGKGVCSYPGPTRSALGSGCTTGSECRSGFCDPENDICAEPCDGPIGCPAPYACESRDGTDLCTLPGPDTSGCRASSGSQPGWTLALLALLAGARRRRRR